MPHPHARVCPNNGPLAYSLGGLLFWVHPNPQTWKMQKNTNLQKGWKPLCAIQTSTPLTIVHMASSCKAKNWYSIILNILLHVSPTFH
jgi:hypothetical protein